MKKSILKQMMNAEIRAVESTEKNTETQVPITNPLAGRRHSSPVINNVGRALSQLAEDSIVTLEPSKIERSPFSDRFEADTEVLEELEALKQSIASEGQKIPVLVRPHPNKLGLYQLAYGYRRLAAIKALNDETGRTDTIKVKAYIRELSDRQLIEEQSLENGVREGLTWIEQAMWTVQLKNAGLTQRAICPILGLTEAAISHFVKVTAIIPEEIIYAIGRAKSIGRPKWTSLAELMSSQGKLEIAYALINTSNFQIADSTTRFAQMFDALKEKNKALTNEPITLAWQAKDNSIQILMNQRSKKVTLELSNINAKPFSSWLSNHLDQLYEEFEKSKNSEIGD